jgi:hypothetical protein
VTRALPTRQAPRLLVEIRAAARPQDKRGVPQTTGTPPCVPRTGQVGRPVTSRDHHSLRQVSAQPGRFSSRGANGVFTNPKRAIAKWTGRTRTNQTEMTSRTTQ